MGAEVLKNGFRHGLANSNTGCTELASEKLNWHVSTNTHMWTAFLNRFNILLMHCAGQTMQGLLLL